MTCRLLAVAAVALLAGAGCDLSKKIEWRLPFALEDALPAADPAAATGKLALEDGFAFTVRPSRLGVSAGIEEALGLDARAVEVTVTEADPERALALSWSVASASGTLALGSYAEARAMLLPAFWPDGHAEASANGGLWLSRAAYAELVDGDGEAEWRLGLAEGALSAVSRALRTFNDLSAKLAGSATSAPITSPFAIRKTATVEAYPLAVDGRIVLVRAVKASGWFGDFLVLAHPENPLILKATVNPLAEPALRALEGAVARWDELGYEITSIRRP